MTPTTRKVSGPAMERLFRQILAEDGGVAPEKADRLAHRLALVLSSVRARRVPLKDLAGRRRASPPPPPSVAPAVSPPATAAPAETSAKFDPFVFGLVPVFQREGRDGLITRLSGIATVDHLRAMAKAQNVALDARLKSADVSVADLRSGIAAAVEKRIADRRAAAS